MQCYKYACQNMLFIGQVLPDCKMWSILKRTVQVSTAAVLVSVQSLFISKERFAIFQTFICPIAIAYSMGQIIKSVCVCQSVYLCVRLFALSWSHFLIDFHQN